MPKPTHTRRPERRPRDRGALGVHLTQRPAVHAGRLALCLLRRPDGLPCHPIGRAIKRRYDDYDRQTQNNPALIPAIRAGTATFDVQPVLAEQIQLLGSFLSYYGGVRGPHSKNFINHACSNCHVNLIGDAGLLMSTLHPAKLTKKDVYKIFGLSEKLPYIFANCAKMMMKNYAYGTNDAASERNFVDSMSFILEMGFHIVLFPMWVGEVEFMKQVAAKISTEASKTTDARCISLSTVPDISIISSFMTHSHSVISYRLHGQILAAAYGKPLIAIAYGFKTFDFMDMVLVSSLSSFWRKYHREYSY